MLSADTSNFFHGLLFYFGTSGFMDFALTILACIVHIAFAYGVLRDAELIDERAAGSFLVGPKIWAIATLAGGIPVMAVYWIIHYSTLRHSVAPDPFA